MKLFLQAEVNRYKLQLIQPLLQKKIQKISTMFSL